MKKFFLLAILVFSCAGLYGKTPVIGISGRQSPTKMATATHSVTIERGSCLSSLLGGVEKKAVNSAHHQAMKDVPAGLKVVARSADGIVEAVERCGTIYGYKDGGAWILGLQFHPEELICGGDSSFLPVFQELVRHAQ